MALFCNLEARQLKINDRRTSIALEPLYWSEIEKLSRAGSLTWRQWVQHELDDTSKGRASLLRVAVLKAVKITRQ